MILLKIFKAFLLGKNHLLIKKKYLSYFYIINQIAIGIFISIGIILGSIL